MIRVFIVDDSAFVRRALTRVLDAEPGIRVVGDAESGAEALARICAITSARRSRALSSARRMCARSSAWRSR